MKLKKKYDASAAEYGATVAGMKEKMRRAKGVSKGFKIGAGIGAIGGILNRIRAAKVLKRPMGIKGALSALGVGAALGGTAVAGVKAQLAHGAVQKSMRTRHKKITKGRLRLRTKGAPLSPGQAVKYMHPSELYEYSKGMQKKALNVSNPIGGVATHEYAWRETPQWQLRGTGKGRGAENFGERMPSSSASPYMDSVEPEALPKRNRKKKLKQGDYQQELAIKNETGYKRASAQLDGFEFGFLDEIERLRIGEDNA